MSGSNSSHLAGAAVGPEPAAGPQPLVLTVHDLAPPDLADAALQARERTLGGRLKMLLVLAVCAAPVLASYIAFFVVRPEGRTNYGTLISPTRALPEATFTTLDGRAVAAVSLKGQWLLVAVGPAACDAACERRLYVQRQLREMLGRDRDRLDKLWLVIDDAPLPAPLHAALQAAPAATVLRAERAAIASWLRPADGHALEDHLYLVDPLGQWMMRLPADPDPARVKRDLVRLLGASASWDRPGR